MFNRFYLSIQLIFLITFNCFSQTYWIPRTPLFDSLYKWDRQISRISQTEDQYFLPISINGVKANQQIIKNKKDLYILVEGTGFVYKAIAQNSSEIAFTRIDSTFFLGYNFKAFNFAYKDTLFSMGGNGYWHTNGQLRYFKPGFDWDLILLNIEMFLMFPIMLPIMKHFMIF